jgi:hypothetical protein
VFLHGVRYSYSSTPTNGQLLVAWSDGVTNFTETHAVTTGGPGYLTYGGNSKFPNNQVVTVTLKAAGAVNGTVYPNAEYR